MWRGRLKVLGLVLAIGGLVGVGSLYHVAASLEGQDFTLSLRQVELISNGVALASAFVVAALMVVLPRVFFGWPAGTPGTWARLALGVAAAGSAALLVLAVITGVGHVSELGKLDAVRDFTANNTEAWASVFRSLATGLASVIPLILSIAGFGVLGRSRSALAPVAPSYGPRV